MLELLAAYIPQERTLGLFREVIDSFQSTGPGKGLPLGNLTSQMLVNIYMNEFDQYTKHQLKARYYVRYADDFVILHEDKKTLEALVPRISTFLRERLKLSLHPHKVEIRTYASGVDFLGWVHFANHRVLRTATKHRMIRNLRGGRNEARIESYRGMVSHGNSRKIAQKYLQ